MLDLSWSNIIHSNMLNFLILVIVLYFLLKDKIKNAIDNMTEKTNKTVNDSILNKEAALKTLEETKSNYEQTPQETAEIKNIALNTLSSLERKAKEDTEKAKHFFAENITKSVDSEASRIQSALIKETAKNSVDNALNSIRARLNQDETLHDKLIEKAIEELENIS